MVVSFQVKGHHQPKLSLHYALEATFDAGFWGEGNTVQFKGRQYELDGLYILNKPMFTIDNLKPAVSELHLIHRWMSSPLDISRCLNIVVRLRVGVERNRFLTDLLKSYGIVST